MNITDSWKRIADWYSQNDNGEEGMQLRLAPGAGEEQILALELALGVGLPGDMRQSYLVHDGTDETWLVHYQELLSLAQIERQWRTFTQWQKEEV